MTAGNDALLRQAPTTEGFIAFDPAEIESSIAARFEKQAGQFADHLAFDDDLSRSMTYAELNESANRVAVYLVDRDGEQPGKAVGLLFGYSAESLIAAMGVLKAGRMIVALDPTYPTERNRYMLEDSESRILISDRPHRTMAEGFAASVEAIITIEEIIGQSGNEANPTISFAPDTYSHLIYTSGSTGQPKGVIHTHRTLLHLHCYANHAYQFCADDRNALLASMSYGNSLMQIYNALLNGGAVIPFDLRSRPMGDMPAWLRDQRISYISYVPSIFRQLFRYLDDDDRFPDMRILAIGGESYRPDDIEAYRRWFSQSTLGLSYGTSEALWITHGFAEADTEIDPQTIPIGFLFGEHKVVIVDDEGQAVDDGEIGALRVSSRYLTPGYWRRPELNKMTFKDDLEREGMRWYDTGDLAERRVDSNYIHRGRKDYQIKVRGYRVEAGEVEAALIALEEVAEAVVVLNSGRQNSGYLVAYVVAENDASPTSAALRARLGERLPTFMVPASVIMLDALPRTLSGKIDRTTLPTVSETRPTLQTRYRTPETPLESAIVAIWEDAFEIEPIGIDDSFLELGGHSLLATQIVSEVQRTLASHVPVTQMFETETVAELAALIVENDGTDGEEGAPDIEKVERGDFKKKLLDSGTILDNELE